ncbi:RNA polymerase-binding transcription factor [Buchnera aphidicola (Schlechtendalia chinensis)]|uniref:RNA polymerase-binding transcription factor DksA n=1 Tax=Buchnera aphidicola subsp. Schlechtendalia chinensis TaxID=118110 RepID=A0A172WDH6_BUCSC|nr:RNA polymerase-binding protein DksA [Buchnera aphidicola]ANF16987.1 RNA polymerase-binding transcription factor [Buchnera aphidicola (Schlechtendalia chinensis)]
MQKEKNKKRSSLSILYIAGVQPYENKKNEKYMNTKQINHFKKILIAWAKQLKNGTSKKELYIQEKTTNFPDPIDRAVQEEEFSFALRHRDRERKLICKIEETLKKVEKNDFGYCESCGVEIGIRRLEARPTANLCIDCKTLSEIREKQMLG